MITANVTSTETVKTFIGGLDGAQRISFGFAGALAPARWQLTVRSLPANEKKSARDLYSLQLTGYKISGPNQLSFRGSYGYPFEGHEDPNDYGYGAAGYITELPEEILEAISEAAGVDITNLDGTR